MSEVVYSVKISISLLRSSDQIRDRDPLAGGAEEVLLARGADDVGVGVAVAHVLQRPSAAHHLVARLHVDLRVLFGGRQPTL